MKVGFVGGDDLTEALHAL